MFKIYYILRKLNILGKLIKLYIKQLPTIDHSLNELQLLCVFHFYYAIYYSKSNCHAPLPRSKNIFTKYKVHPVTQKKPQTEKNSDIRQTHTNKD